ncbi:hypothetical protein F0562_026024 [Nyssa sinensis]|uniref:Uncharacterized protein n=1 Tax=Nyssa sinensis TaxID=561372 RepID=A0A5J5BBU2_9ASTE|nr:hypothetical protein F0562_026024 [Nyssa sinensis]
MMVTSGLLKCFPRPHLTDPASLVGLFTKEIAPVLEARCHFGHSKVVDSELAGVSAGPELAAAVAGLEHVVGAADSDMAVVVGLVMAVVESVRLKLVYFELNSPQFGSGAEAGARAGIGSLGCKFQAIGCLIDFIEEENFVKFP